MFILEWGPFQQTGWVVAVPTTSSKKAGVQPTEEVEREPGIQLWKPAEEPSAVPQVVNKAWVKRKDYRRNSKTRKTAPWKKLTNETDFPFKTSRRAQCAIQLGAAPLRWGQQKGLPL